MVPVESSYELLLVVYSNFRRIDHRFRDKVHDVLMLKTTVLPTPLESDIEFEGHVVGIWRRNLAPEN